MTARVLIFSDAARKRQRARLTLAEDDYAIKVTSDDDPHFWVRVERGGGGSIVVSDFIRGNLTDDDLIEGLRLAVRSLGGPDRTQIVFRDMVPCAADAGRAAVRMERVAESARRAARAMAADGSRRMAAFGVRPRGGKMDAVATLS